MPQPGPRRHQRRLGDVFVVQMDVAPPMDGVVKDGDEGNDILKGTRRDDILRGHGGKDWLFGTRAMTGWRAVRATTRYLAARATTPCLAAGHDRIWTGKGQIWLSSTKAMAMTGSSISTSVVAKMTTASTGCSSMSASAPTPLTILPSWRR